MSQQRQEMRNKARSSFWRAAQAMKSIMQEESGVTAIEYSLLAALIVVVALAGIVALGSSVDGVWTLIAAEVSAAL